jgi:hypothetical protein
MARCPLCDVKVSLLRSTAVGNLGRLADATKVAERFRADMEAIGRERGVTDSPGLRDSELLLDDGISLRDTWHRYVHKAYNGPLPFAQARDFLARIDRLLAMVSGSR